jgi:hypothetical protein
MFHKFGEGDAELPDKMRAMMGPGVVDDQIRQAIHFCWMMLPAERRNVAEVEKEIRSIVERALKALRDDEGRFKP